MGSKSVLVMWDYSAYPLWTSGTRRPENDPTVVPLSGPLLAALVDWANMLEEIMAGAGNRGWEGPSNEAVAHANEVGAELAQRVKDELDDTWTVEYHDEVTNERRILVRTPRPIHKRHHRR